MQIENDSYVEPSFSRPDIADVARPLLVRLIGMEVPVQQVRRNIESVIAIRCDLVLLRPLNADAILAHQSANQAMTDVQTHLFQFFGHAWTAIAAHAETRLFLNVGQDNHVSPLPLAGRSAAISTQTAGTNLQDVAHGLRAKGITMFFDKSEPHGF